MDIVELALEAYGPPVYVHHEIVHNRYVVEQLRERGAIFVESVEEVPIGAVLIFSAHGVPPTVREEAQQRQLRVIDATCPLVTKVHLEALRFAREGRTIILIGHKDHQEIIGTSGEAPEQTVVVDSVEAVNRLEVRRPEAAGISDADDAEPLRHQGDCGAAAGALSAHRRAGLGRYLLRHAEPPGSRGVRSARSAADFGGGFAEQLEFQPPGGSSRARRRAGAADRRRQRRFSRNGRGRRQCGLDGGRICAGSAGRAGERAPGGIWLHGSAAISI